MDAVRKFFENIKTLHFSIVASAICCAVNMVCSFFTGNYTGAVSLLIVIPCIITLGVSYDRHNKNVMKAMIGAVLMWYVTDIIDFDGHTVIPQAVSADGAYHSANGYVFILFEALLVLMFSVLFVNHFVINSDHHSSPANVMANQVIVLVAAGVAFMQVFMAFNVIDCAAGIIGIVCRQLSQVTFLTSIVGVESKLDAYRIQREQK